MQKITVDQWRHVPAGTRIWNGYSNGYCQAPKEPGFYTLYQLVNDRNCHVGWRWEREQEAFRK